MGLIVASVSNQRAPGTTVTSLTEDIRFGYTAHALHYNLFSLGVTATVSTLQALVDKLTSMNISTTNGQPETTIDGDDWFDLLPYLGIAPYISNLTAADNIPHAFGVSFPLSPFSTDPTKNFGLPPNKGVQFTGNYSADVSPGYDGFAYDLTVEGVTADIKPNPIGYIKVVQDSYTPGAVGESNDTDVVGNRLLGVMNFETTAFDDLAAAAAFDVTTIREQSVLFSNDIRIGPYKISRSWAMKPVHTEVMSGTASLGNLLDIGHTFSDYGIFNSAGNLGLNISGANIKVRSVAGVANATRVNPIVLVN